MIIDVELCVELEPSDDESTFDDRSGDEDISEPSSNSTVSIDDGRRSQSSRKTAGGSSHRQNSHHRVSGFNPSWLKNIPG